MAEYTKVFDNPYPEGWKDLPSEETPITAAALQEHTDAIENIENYLEENPIDGGGTDVQWNQLTSSGTHIADITIDGETTEVFAPNGGGGGSDVVELTKAEYDALPDTKLTDGKQYFIKDYSESGSGSVGIITQRITIQNHSGFNPKYDYPSGVNFNDYIILNYHECPPDYAYSRIGHNSLQANQFSSTSDRFFLEMHEDGLYVFNNASFFDGKEIIVIYGKRG